MTGQCGHWASRQNGQRKGRRREGGRARRERGGEASPPARSEASDLVATRTNEEDVDRPRKDGRTDRWMGRSSCRGVAHSNHSIDLSHPEGPETTCGAFCTTKTSQPPASDSSSWPRTHSMTSPGFIFRKADRDSSMMFSKGFFFQNIPYMTYAFSLV